MTVDLNSPILVSFEELLSAIGGSTYFALDELINQISECDDKKEDFKIIHREAFYIVPKEKIQEYFELHKKPQRKMSIEEEVKILRSRVAELEAKAGKIEPEAPIEFKEMRKPTERIPSAYQGGAEILVPQRDPNIPKPTIEEIQADLRKDLQLKRAVGRPRVRK